MVSWKTIAAIAGIVILEWQALAMGIDGALFALVIAAIAGLGGYHLRKEVIKNG